MRRKALVNVLELLKPALAEQAMVAVFQNYCFTGSNVYAYNDALGVIGPCTVPKPFSVHGETLLGLLRNCRTEDVEVELQDDVALLIAGRSKMRLPYLEEAEFLFKEPEDEDWIVNLEIDNRLLEAMDVCLTTSSSDNATAALMGITLVMGDGVSFYSCDAEAITHYLIDGANDSDNEGEYILSNEFYESVLRVCSRDKATNGRLMISGDWGLAELEGGYRVYGRVIKAEDSAEFPDTIEKHLDGKDPPWMKIPKGLEHALSRARVVADPMNKPTTITIKDGKMKLYTDTDMGTVRDTVNLSSDVPDVEIPIQAALMARSIGVCSEMAVLENCTCYRKGEDLFQLLSTFGD